MTLQSVEVQEPYEFERAFAGMMRERPDALIVTADATHQLRQAWIVDFAAKRASCPTGEHYGRAATYVDKDPQGRQAR